MLYRDQWAYECSDEPEANHPRKCVKKNFFPPTLIGPFSTVRRSWTLRKKLETRPAWNVRFWGFSVILGGLRWVWLSKQTGLADWWKHVRKKKFWGFFLGILVNGSQENPDQVIRIYGFFEKLWLGRSPPSEGVGDSRKQWREIHENRRLKTQFCDKVYSKSCFSCFLPAGQSSLNG